MALGLVLLPAFALALLAGGRPGRLADVEIRWLPLVFAAIGLQVVAFPFGFLPWTTPGGAAVALWLASYALLLAVAARNLSVPGIALATAGAALNLVAVTANGGRMPVLPEAMRAAGESYDVRHNSVAEDAPRLPWLVDRWAAPSWVPLANVFSVGDATIAAGGAWFVFGATGAGLPGRRRRPGPAAPAEADEQRPIRVSELLAAYQASERRAAGPTGARSGRQDAGADHWLFVPLSSGYEIVPRAERLPARGGSVFYDGISYRVSLVGRSPFLDGRPCVYLEPTRRANVDAEVAEAA